MGGTVSRVAKDVTEGAEGLVKNVERNVGQSIADLGQMSKGNFSGAGNSLLRLYTMNTDVRAYGANPDDVKLGTGSVMAAKKMQDAANNMEAADVVAQLAEKDRQAQSVVSGLVSARRNRTGRGGSTLLPSSSGSNTLLTLVNK